MYKAVLDYLSDMEIGTSASAFNSDSKKKKIVRIYYLNFTWWFIAWYYVNISTGNDMGKNANHSIKCSINVQTLHIDVWLNLLDSLNKEKKVLFDLDVFSLTCQNSLNWKL